MSMWVGNKRAGGMRQATGIRRSQQLGMMLDVGILVQTCNPGKGGL